MPTLTPVLLTIDDVIPDEGPVKITIRYPGEKEHFKEKVIDNPAGRTIAQLVEVNMDFHEPVEVHNWHFQIRTLELQVSG